MEKLVDFLIKNGVIVTMNHKRQVLVNHSLVIRDGRIAQIGKTEEVQNEHPYAETVDANHRIVMPGLVCSHSHLYGMLLRGASLNVTPPSEFTQILQRIWWPVDEAMTYDDAYASALVACVEFAKSGVTTFADTYSGPNSMPGVLDRIAEAVEAVGIRGFLAFEATERHSREEGFKGNEENVRFAEKILRRPNSRAKSLFSLHASFTVSDELIREVKRVAERFHSPITIHASEGLVDLHHNLERYGKRTIERLHNLGLLGPNVVLAHCVHLNEEEIDLISKTNTGVAHNPMSNMLNAVGVSPVTRMLQLGINIGLGNDGYVFDMFENMRVAFLLHRVHTRNPNALDPYTVLEMATINGARLYGIDTEVGSIEIGKKADVIVVRPSILPTPLNAESAIGHIINTASADDVEQVFFGGEPLVRNKHLESVDEEKAEQISQDVAGKLWERLKTVRPHLDTVMQD